jgi:AbiV family abortive infection protein
MAKNKLSALSDDELADGAWLTFQNACRLVDDAKSLIEVRRDLAAQGMLRIAVEEAAKVFLLLQASYWEKTDSEQWVRFWQTWENHKQSFK